MLATAIETRLYVAPSSGYALLSKLVDAD